MAVRKAHTANSDNLTPDELNLAAAAVRVAARRGQATDYQLLKLAERMDRSAKAKREREGAES